MQTAVKSKPLKRRRSSRRRFLYRIKEIGALLPTKTRAVLLNAATYYPAGPSAGWTYGNGRVMTRTYDKDYRASTIKDAGVGGIDIGLRYDNAGYLTQLTNAALATTPRAKYQYDALGRLLKTSDGSSNAAIETYTYDATGNRTSLALGTAAAQAYTYQSTSHKLTQVGSVGRTYDAMGNLTAVGGITREYVYNNAGRMSATKQNNATTATYVYNGLGEQVKRTVGATVTVFVYDEGGMLLGQYTGTAVPVQQYVWMDTMPVGVIGSNNTLHYVEADHLGTPRAVIDATRQTAPNADPDADGTAFNLDLRMPGQRYDQASGLYYNYFRDYDPATGRYTQVDPIGLAGGISTFGYVGGDPMSFSDPAGLMRFVRPDRRNPAWSIGPIGDLEAMPGVRPQERVLPGAWGIAKRLSDLEVIPALDELNDGDNDCAELIKMAYPAPHSSTWRAFRQLRPGMDITPGTFIFTPDANGRYAQGDSDWRHAAIFIGFSDNGIYVLDQYDPDPTLNYRELLWRYPSNDPHARLVNSAENFYTGGW
jgi:RHS repeat-associated protein